MRLVAVGEQWRSDAIMTSLLNFMHKFFCRNSLKRLQNAEWMDG